MFLLYSIYIKNYLDKAFSSKFLQKKKGFKAFLINDYYKIN